MKTTRREFDSTSAFTIRDIYDSDGDRVTSAGTEVSEAVFEIKSRLDSATALLTLTKSGGRIIANSDLLTFKLIKGTDFSALRPNRTYFGILTLTVNSDEAVGTKFKIIFGEN